MSCRVAFLSLLSAMVAQRVGGGNLVVGWENYRRRNLSLSTKMLGTRFYSMKG
jgi:hypothetical protein